MENNKKRRFLGVLKKYGYIAVAFVLVLGLTLGIVLATTSGDEPNVDPEEPTGSGALVFELPCESPDVKKWYSDSDIMYNATLNQWEAHMAVDLVSKTENLNVYSVLDGVVTDITETYEYGTIITVTHSDGFVSKYSSLDEETAVSSGDQVQKGDVLGKMSKSAHDEIKEGNHLHFELYKDGQKVDPANYLTLENK